MRRPRSSLRPGPAAVPNWLAQAESHRDTPAEQLRHRRVALFANLFGTRMRQVPASGNGMAMMPLNSANPIRPQ